MRCSGDFLCAHKKSTAILSKDGAKVVGFVRTERVCAGVCEDLLQFAGICGGFCVRGMSIEFFCYQEGAVMFS